MPLKPVHRGWDPRHWVSLSPFGIGHLKPNNFYEVFRAVSENRDQLNYAYKILNEGVCDGCALGTTGMRDWTIKGVHLCNIRLRLLRLNTMPALNPEVLQDISKLSQKSSADLRELGRIPFPLLRRRGDSHFSRISWEDALDHISVRVRSTDPEKLGVYVTSRGIPNETYYVVQKAVRAMGSNNIDNAARICHSPSTVALKEAIGVGATTCSYKDMIGTDVIVFVGSNPAVNQPVMMKYLYYAKKAGTKIIMVNPYREPAMDKYWIPSDPESALFGTRVTDTFYQVVPGGDIAFLSGTLRHIIEHNWLDNAFIQDHTTGFDEVKQRILSTPWEDFEKSSGLTRTDMLEFALTLFKSQRGILVWSMGVTQNTRGEDTVHAVVNLALSRGFLGQEGSGLMPIRGHSGVQGGAEMGAYANVLPGGIPATPENLNALSEKWQFQAPTSAGLNAPEMLEQGMDVLWSIGGNFLEVLPDPEGVKGLLSKVPLRIHQDIFLTSQMLVEGDEVLILPATTRYEIPGGVTETSTERRVIFSPEIEGPRIEEARWEGRVFLDVARLVKPELAEHLTYTHMGALREEISRVIPMYSGIEKLRSRGDAFQYGGNMLCRGGHCPTPDGKAHFKAIPLPERNIPEGAFSLVTRRGKQFNSMIHEHIDPVNKAPREGILISHLDAELLGLKKGDPVRVHNSHGEMLGTAFPCDLKRGSLQVHWPEGNVLLDPSKHSPKARIPAYKESFAFLEKRA